MRISPLEPLAHRDPPALLPLVVADQPRRFILRPRRIISAALHPPHPRPAAVGQAEAPDQVQALQLHHAAVQRRSISPQLLSQLGQIQPSPRAQLLQLHHQQHRLRPVATPKRRQELRLDHLRTGCRRHQADPAVRCSTLLQPFPAVGSAASQQPLGAALALAPGPPEQERPGPGRRRTSRCSQP